MSSEVLEADTNEGDHILGLTRGRQYLKQCVVSSVDLEFSKEALPKEGFFNLRGSGRGASCLLSFPFLCSFDHSLADLFPRPSSGHTCFLLSQSLQCPLEAVASKQTMYLLRHPSHASFSKAWTKEAVMTRKRKSVVTLTGLASDRKVKKTLGGPI